jgi:hypothetical protein
MLSTRFLAAAFSASALLAQEQPRPNFQYNTANPQAPEKSAAKPPVKPQSQQNRQTLPQVMHFCAQHCFTFTLQKDGTLTNYTAFSPGQSFTRIFTVERFTPESVIIHRIDNGNTAAIDTYAGPMGDNGTSLSGSSANRGPWKITWGSGLDSIPGNDEELAVRSRQPASCNPSQPISPNKAEDLGLLAFSDKNPDAGICWFRMAAAEGEPNAQGVLAVILYKGMYDARIDIPEKCLAQMYDRGDGIAQDSDEALYWRVKATTDEQAQKLRQQQAEEAQQARQAQQAQLQEQQAGPLSLLELLLGAFAGGTSGPPDHSVYIDPNRVRREACASGGPCH